MAAKRTAAETYRDRMARARTMLATLGALLDAHEKEQAKRPDDWGLPGDLGWVNERLGEIGAFLEREEAVAQRVQRGRIETTAEKACTRLQPGRDKASWVLSDELGGPGS